MLCPCIITNSPLVWTHKSGNPNYEPPTDVQNQHPTIRRRTTTMVPSTLTKYHLHHQVQKNRTRKTKPKTYMDPIMVSMDGTSSQRLYTIDVTQHTSQKQEANESRTQYIFYPPELKCQK